MRAAVMLWVRAEWRRRRVATVGLVVLVGIAGAVVLTIAAGARRTSTSLERFAAETRVADVAMDVGDVEAATVQMIAEHPLVTHSGAISVVYAAVDGVDEDLALWIPRGDQAGSTIERHRLLRGRRPDPARRDEVAVNERAAFLAGVDIGDELTIGTLSAEQVADEDYFPPRGPLLRVHVVGVVRGAEDLVASTEGKFYASPALLDVVEGRADVFTTLLGVRLEPGTTDAQFEDAVRGLMAGADLEKFSHEAQTKPVRHAIAALTAGLALFGVVAAVASIVFVGLAVGRHLSGTAGNQRVLGALGMTGSDRLGGLVLFVAPIVVGGAVAAVAGAVLASPVMPIGVARRAEPDPGFSVDVLVLVVGFAAVAFVVIGSALISGWVMARGRRSSPVSAASSVVVAATSRLGVKPVTATGVRLAFDRRPPSLPVRSALLSATVAVIGVTAVLTFATSLDRLAGETARWGFPWDVMLNFTSDTVDRAADEIAGDETLAGAARWDSGFSYVNGRGTTASGLTPLGGSIGFSLRSGRQPARADEVVLGQDTAERLAVSVGDTVDVASGSDVSPTTVSVVGIALFPAVDQGDFTDGIGYFAEAFGEHATVPAQFEASQLVVTVVPGLDRDEVIASLGERYPDSVSGESLPVPPGGVGNLFGVRTLPRWLAAFVVGLGLASLAHVLATTLTRRGRELATLRSLGWTSGQTAGCVAWQAVTIATAGLVVGIPLGLIAGRAAWWAVADPIGVAPDAVRPVASLLAVCAGAVLAAVVLAVPVGRRANRRPPAMALRVE